MSYTTRVIGTRNVLQDDRIMTVNAGSPAPTAASGYSIIKLSAVGNKDVYLEYKIYDGPFQ